MASDDRLTAFSKDGLAYQGIQLAALAELSYLPLTGKVYERSARGLFILDPANGERVHALEPLHQIQSSAPPSYADGILYVLSDGGYVHAVRHPPL